MTSKTTSEPIAEAPGRIEPDSLAAESLEGQGDFGRNNPKVSIAKEQRQLPTDSDIDQQMTRLAPAPDAETRRAREGWSESQILNEGKGLLREATEEEKAREGVRRPKGKNLEEGGFGPGLKNASFNGAIGGKNDPGRLAEAKFEKMNAQGVNDAAFDGPRQTELTGKGKYDVLKQEST